MGTSIQNLTVLSTTDAISQSDRIAIGSGSLGGDAAVSLALFAEFIESLLTVPTALQSQYASPSATGFTVTVSPTDTGGSVWLILTPVAGYAAGTIVLPTSTAAQDGQEVLVNCTQSVTTLTFSASGASVIGAPTTLAANAFFRMRYDAVGLKWYRVG